MTATMTVDDGELGILFLDRIIAMTDSVAERKGNLGVWENPTGNDIKTLTRIFLQNSDVLELKLNN